MQQITYYVDGVPVSSLNPEQQFIWDISALSDGLHAVVAEVKDEQGVIARSEPLQATIRKVIPPAPTPTPLTKIITKGSEEETGRSETPHCARTGHRRLGSSGGALRYVEVSRAATGRERYQRRSQGDD